MLKTIKCYNTNNSEEYFEIPVLNKKVIGYIYLTYFKNKPKYVGQTRKLTYHHSTTYLGSGVILRKMIKKYGKKNFFSIILDEASSQVELDEKEKYYIQKYNTLIPKFGGNGFNISSGGDQCNSIHLIGQNNPCSKTNMILEKRLLKAKKGSITRKNNIKSGKTPKRIISEDHKLKLSIRMKNIWENRRKDGSDKILMNRITEINKQRGNFKKISLIRNSILAKKIEKFGGHNSKYYKLIDPKGNVYESTTSFSKFCQKNNLSKRILLKFLNKGKITKFSKNISSPKSKNTLNWEITGGQLLSEWREQNGIPNS